MKHTKKALFFRLLWYIIMILVSLVFCFPVLYLIFTGFKTPQETVAFPPTLIPKKWTLSAYEEGLVLLHIFILFLPGCVCNLPIQKIYLFT